MEERLKILLNKGRSETYINEDSDIKVHIDNISRPLPLNDIDTKVSAYEQFQKERAESTKYRFYGFVEPLISNPLYNDNVKIFYEAPDIKATKIRSDEIFEKDGWVGYYQDDSVSNGISNLQDIIILSGEYVGGLSGVDKYPEIQFPTNTDLSMLYQGYTITVTFTSNRTLQEVTESFPISGVIDSTDRLFLQDDNYIFRDNFPCEDIYDGNGDLIGSWPGAGYSVQSVGLQAIQEICNYTGIASSDIDPNYIVMYPNIGNFDCTDPCYPQPVQVTIIKDVNASTFNDNKSALCDFFPFDPGYDRLSFLDSDDKPNYLMKITYPAQQRDDIELIDGLPLSKGIPIVEKIPIRFNGRDYTGFRTPLNHGLSTNDTIVLSGASLNTSNFNDNFVVRKLGDSANNRQFKIFVLDINPDDVQITVGQTTVKRVVNDRESQYYVRVLSGLTKNYLDYDLYPAAYGVDYFNDKEVAYNFKTDVDVGNVKDNLGRPLSEVFLTIIKNDEDGNTNKINTRYWEDIQTSKGLTSDFWTPIKGGFDIGNVGDTSVQYNIKAINDNSYAQTHFENIDESDNTFIGDIVEYNEFELLERILENSYHWINTTYRENYSLFVTNPPTASSLIPGAFRSGQGSTQSITFTSSQNIHVSTFTVGSFINLCFYDRRIDKEQCESFEVLYIDSINPTVTYINIDEHEYQLSDALNENDVVHISTDGCPCKFAEIIDNKKEGYIYKPHNRIIIREYSSYVESGIEGQVINIPDYAVNTYSFTGSTSGVTDSETLKIINTKRWRDLLSVGFYDVAGQGVNYPFESGAHYIFLNSRFYMKRQDPACNYTFNGVNFFLPSQKEELYNVLSQPSYFDYAILNAEIFDTVVVATDDVVDLGAMTITNESKYAYERAGKEKCGGITLFKTRIITTAGLKTLYNPDGDAINHYCQALNGFVKNKGGLNQNFKDESDWYCDPVDAWEESAGIRIGSTYPKGYSRVYNDCDGIGGSTMVKNFCIAAGGVGEIVLKKSKDKSNACYREIEVDVRTVEYYGEYNLGQVDTPGACIDFNFTDVKVVDEQC